MSPDKARALFEYDPDTGVITWRHRPRSAFKTEASFATFSKHQAGQQGGSVGGSGYYEYRHLGRPYLAHRIAWMIVHGVIPEQIDHIDGDRLNNRMSNLRSVSCLDNSRNMPRQKNNKTGVVGVSWNTLQKKWVAVIGMRGKQVHLGTFDDFNDAVLARKTAEKQFGFHPNHGRAA